LTGSTPQESVASCCITCARIAHTPCNQTCGKSYRTIPFVAVCWVSQYCLRVGGPRCTSSIDGSHLDLFLDIVVATGHHVDVLPVLWLCLVKSFDDKKLHSTTKVLLAQVILLDGYILRVGWLREVLVHLLLPGSFVLALEHILKLHKRVREVEIDLLGPLFKVRDCFVGCDSYTKFSTILVDFGLEFVTRIIALQLISLRQLDLLVPCLF
jgi:hypothetical protein